MTRTRSIQIRMLAVGGIAPLAIALGGAVAVLLALGELPSPVAVHWGPSGSPDGFGSPWLAIILPLLIVLLFGALVIQVTRMTAENGVVSANQKLIVCAAPFLAIVVTGVVAGSTLMQRGLTDATFAPPVAPLLGASLGFAVLVAVVSWFVLPRVSAAIARDDERPVLDLQETARAVWMQHVSPQRAFSTVVIVILVTAIVGGGVAVGLFAPLAAFVVYVAGMAAALVVVVGTLYWRVTIDSRGFRTVSLLGFPRFVIPISEIESAVVTTVQPLGDFGGWGLRWGGRKRMGIVLRAGEALQVNRTDGRQLVVTVPRARTGAALLNSLALRA